MGRVLPHLAAVVLSLLVVVFSTAVELAGGMVYNNTVAVIPWIDAEEESRGTLRLRIALLSPATTIVDEPGGMARVNVTLVVEFLGEGAVVVRDCLRAVWAGRSPGTPIVLDIVAPRGSCSVAAVVHGGEGVAIDYSFGVIVVGESANGGGAVLGFPLRLFFARDGWASATLAPGGSIVYGGDGAGLRLWVEKIGVVIEELGVEEIVLPPPLVEAETRVVTVVVPSTP